MDARTVLREMELAAYELAEAESAERRARQLRTAAAKRLASCHAEFQDAIAEADAKPTHPTHQR